MRTQSMVQFDKKGRVFGGENFYSCLMVKEGTRESILESARRVMEYHPDLVEWRLDYVLPMEDTDFAEEMLVETARQLADVLDGVPLLITFRVKEEGGIRKYPRELRLRMVKACIRTGLIDFIDVEIGSDQAYVDEIREACAPHGTKLILSYHNWETVPEEAFLIEKVKEAIEKGADIPKLYTTANTYEEALRVMQTAVKVRKEGIAGGPMIFCGMSHSTLLTRVMGGDVANDFVYLTITGEKGGVEEDVRYYNELREVFHI